MKQFLFAALAVAATFCVHAAPVTISSTNFDGFTNGTVNGQGGWGVTGGYDQEVVDFGGGNKALRLSNKTTSSSFGDMPFAPRPGGQPANTVGNPSNSLPGFFAGETSTGAGFNKFIGSFDFRSVLSTKDTGARITISPDNGTGGRQGFVALRSTSSGVEIDTFDVNGLGVFVGPTTTGTVALATWHTIRYEILFNDGVDNDVASIFLDNALIATVGSWEDFYSVSQPLVHPLGVPVQTFLFRVSGNAAPDAQGFYIDNVKVQLDNVGQVPEPGTLALALLALTGLTFMRRRRT